MRGILGASAVTLLLVIGCGEEPEPASQLNLLLLDPVTAEQTVFTLRCDPSGGDAPRPASLCRALEMHTEEMLPPQPRLLCEGDLHSRYIGIEGTFDGRRVETALPFCDKNGPERFWLGYVQPPRHVG
jgi:Subtilisin inhibitor-like